MVLLVAAALLILAPFPQARAGCYPQELAKLLASDAAVNDLFGISVAISANTAVIGAYADTHAGGTQAGSAYVFVCSGGVWTEQAKLTAADAAAYDLFGCSVAVSGDTAVIGAYSDDFGGLIAAGSAYVFVRSGGVWTQQAKLTAADAAAYDAFGSSVAVSGDTAVIGAHLDDHAGGMEAGSAYVFVRSGGVWTQQAKLLAPDAAANDLFGFSVAVSGDTAVVGAFLDDHAGGTDAGSAYVFVRSGGVWTQQTKLTASDATTNAIFGNFVAVSADTAVIGAPGDAHGVGNNAGSAYVFVRSGGVWTQEAKLTAADAAPQDFFGVSAGVSADTAVIGANYDDHAGGTDAGSAYVFVRSGGVWSQEAKLTASDAAADDRFGNSVAVSGDTAVIGAAFDDHAGGTDAGSAYVFDLNCTGACCHPGGSCALTTEAGCAGVWHVEWPDCAVAQCPPCAGDLNCDGVIDFGDINPFVLILSNYTLWQQTYPGCPWQNGDINGNNNVGFEDINPFVALMVQSPIQCP